MKALLVYLIYYTIRRQPMLQHFYNGADSAQLFLVHDMYHRVQ